MTLEQIRYISMWFTILMSTIACVSLFAITMTLIDQMLDLHMLIIQNINAILTERSFASIPITELYSYVSAAIFVTFLGWIVYITVIKLITYRASRVAKYQPQIIRSRPFLIFAEVAPLFFFLVILASLPVGMLVADKEELRRTRYLDAAIEVLHPIGVLGLIYALVALILFSATYAIGRQRIADHLFSRRGGLALTAVLATLLGVISYDSVVVAQFVGTIPLVAIFMAFLVYYTGSLTMLSHLTGVPSISAIFCCAIAFAYFDLNDNHRIHYQLKHLNKSSYQPNQFEEAFSAWATARSDRAYYEDKHVPYPVYIVSAEGGGLYAAYNLATFLAKMQDTCPTFAQHLFTISSVSGGSLGAAVFAGLAKGLAENGNQEPCKDDPDKPQFQTFVRDYFSRDFLAPLVAAGLFPDFLQRFLPFVVPMFDRSLALEQSFVSAWEWSVKRGGLKKLSSNPFKQPLDTFWDPKGAIPNLAINLTSVETGARITISPLYFAPTPTTVHINDAAAVSCGEEYVVPSVNLATAVSLSARFPWVTPVGWLETFHLDEGKCRSPRPNYGPRLYLGDGGYFENGGTELVTELSARIRRAAEYDKATFPNGVSVRVIRVGVYDEYVKRFDRPGGERSYRGYGELLAPVVTLLNARRARALAVVFRYSFDDAYFSSGHPLFLGDEQQRRDGSHHPGQELYRLELNATKVFLPLGWQLSKRSMDNMEEEEDGAEKLRELINIIGNELKEGGSQHAAAAHQTVDGGIP
jgi:hypothetical protein